MILLGGMGATGAEAVTTPVSVVATPAQLMQGEPLRATVLGVTSTTSVQSLVFDGSPLGLFVYHGSVSAFVGVDLHKKPGTYALVATLYDGTVYRVDVVVVERPHTEAPLGIPSKLGGNTTASQKKLVDTLAAENASLAKIISSKKVLRSEPFQMPLTNAVVTDVYGYTRQTGAYSIAHKGTDFHASEGTSVMTINRGVVRVAHTYRDYGKTVVVDHGLGVLSFYMHLSKISVAEGQLVTRGQVVGLSGHTGYAEQPHLHLSIRVGGVSVDPMKFFTLLQ